MRQAHRHIPSKQHGSERDARARAWMLAPLAARTRYPSLAEMAISIALSEEISLEDVREAAPEAAFHATITVAEPDLMWLRLSPLNRP
jgi:hypothetical protein